MLVRLICRITRVDVRVYQQSQRPNGSRLPRRWLGKTHRRSRTGCNLNAWMAYLLAGQIENDFLVVMRYLRPRLHQCVWFLKRRHLTHHLVSVKGVAVLKTGLELCFVVGAIFSSGSLRSEYHEMFTVNYLGIALLMNTLPGRVSREDWHMDSEESSKGEA